MAETRLGTLKTSERLLIDRKRRGETQSAAAHRMEMDPYVYGQIERGRKLVGVVAPRVGRLGRLRPNERCLVRRRRSGMTQETLAKNMHRSRYWVNLMENGLADCAELVNFWER